MNETLITVFFVILIALASICFVVVSFALILKIVDKMNDRAKKRFEKLIENETRKETHEDKGE